MKFLLIKSFSGFGDRIEHLLCSLQYAKYSGRTLVIDWTDHVWCGNETNKDFYYYFVLKDTETMNLKDFKTLFINRQKANKRLTVFPDFHYQNMLRRSDEKNIKFLCKDIQDLFRKVITKEMEDLPHDIIVTSDMERRNHAGVFSISRLLYKSFILEYIKEDPNYNFLMKNDFITIHLRGTDRSSYTEENRPDLTNFSHHKDVYVDKLIKKIPQGTKNILLLSDSNILISHFLENVEDIYNIIQTSNEKSSENIGLHIQPRDCKLKCNLELLKDFYFMTFSTHVICDEISRFSLVGKRVCDIKHGREID